jgi:hypothetical protein
VVTSGPRGARARTGTGECPHTCEDCEQEHRAFRLKPPLAAIEAPGEQRCCERDEERAPDIDGRTHARLLILAHDAASRVQTRGVIRDSVQDGRRSSVKGGRVHFILARIDAGPGMSCWFLTHMIVTLTLVGESLVFAERAGAR